MKILSNTAQAIYSLAARRTDGEPVVIAGSATKSLKEALKELRIWKTMGVDDDRFVMVTLSSVTVCEVVADEEDAS